MPYAASRENQLATSQMARLLGSKHRAYDMTGWEIMDEVLRASGMWDAQKNLDAGGQDFALPFEDAHFLNGFANADRKFHFKPDWKKFGGRWQEMPVLPDHLDVIDNATAQKPYRLVAAPARTFLNSTFTETPGSLSREKRPTVKIHPADCAALDIKEGDRVTLGNERVPLAGEGALWGRGPTADDLMAYARTLNVTDPIMRQRLASVYTESEILRLIRLRTVSAAIKGRPPGPEASVRKALADEHGQHIMAVAKDLSGARGMLATQDQWHYGYLFAPALTIGGGTSEVQRNIIGERVLGLPHDIDVEVGKTWSESRKLSV